MFFNEFDMVALRIAELEPVVDGFILVESDSTFSGKPKRYNFEQAGQYFHPDVLDKITYIKISFPIGMINPWEREAFQRNAIVRGIPQDMQDEDILLVSDCDEIPSFPAAKYLKSGEWTNDGVKSVVFVQDLYSFNPHWRWKGVWYGTRALKKKNFTDGYFPQSRRNTTGFFEDEHVIAHGAGWSFSYFGGVKAIQEKVAAYSHTEVNKPEYTNDEHVQESIEKGLPLVRDDGNEYIYIAGDEHLPKFMRENPERYGV